MCSEKSTKWHSMGWHGTAEHSMACWHSQRSKDSPAEIQLKVMHNHHKSHIESVIIVNLDLLAVRSDRQLRNLKGVQGNENHNFLHPYASLPVNFTALACSERAEDWIFISS